MSKSVVVIGAGFSGIAAATCLADAGYSVTVLEKNDSLGGRARKFETQGFVFDMGPSWYWMPEVFEDYFSKFGKKVSDYYKLVRLDPSYRVYFGEDDYLDVPADYKQLLDLFEEIEEGAAKKLDSFLTEAAYKYKVGMAEFVWKPGHSITEFFDVRIVKSAFKLQMFTSIRKQIRALFTNPKLIKILEFPVLFLGATPADTPALYSLMNYADLKLGTWYPLGGMHKIIEGMISLAREKGVVFETNQEVTEVVLTHKRIKSCVTTSSAFQCDHVINSADYHHFDQNVLPNGTQEYTAKYWDKRKLAPSSLLFYIGLDKKLEGIKHHTLFFDEDFDQHAIEIYKKPTWPTKPLFYMCAPSVTDSSVAPDGKENIFFLVPLAPDLKDSVQMQNKYFEVILDRLKSIAGVTLDPKDILYKRVFSVDDFKSDYNAFKGNAYGLANVLSQTAILKPKMKSSKISNLYYTGQLTTPGPGVPPSLISGQLVASELIKNAK